MNGDVAANLWVIAFRKSTKREKRCWRNITEVEQKIGSK
jgi:hypothetical protein